MGWLDEGGWLAFDLTAGQLSPLGNQPQPRGDLDLESSRPEITLCSIHTLTNTVSQIDCGASKEMKNRFLYQHGV